MTTTPTLMPKDAQPEPTPWESLQAVLLTHYHEPDLEAARTIFAAVVAHRLTGQPVWLMLVAPPGSMKTELLESLGGLPRVHVIDRVTPNSFLSGQMARSRAPASLLHRIGRDGILVCPDFSTVLSMHRDHRGAVLADMRRFYDGHLHRELGTWKDLEQREWRGRLTFLVGATPNVDRHYSIFQMLGERFVMVRWSRPGGTESALSAMRQDRQRAPLELREAVEALFGSLPDVQPVLPEEVQRRIAALAEFTVIARTHIPKEGENKEIIYVPEPEASTRLAQQLCQLAKGSALLAGRDLVDEDDFLLVRRVAFDSIPATRRRILDALASGKQPSDAVLPFSTRNYAVLDLRSLKLVVHAWDSVERMGLQFLSRQAKRLLVEAGIRVKRGRYGRKGLVFYRD